MPLDQYFMKRAIHLALRGKGTTSPNPIVGAVVVKGGKIISEGWHAVCGGDHAEVAALRKAGSKAKGASLYVTLEPCTHFGRTPPCVNTIIGAGIKEVYIGALDPNPINTGKSLKALKKAGIKFKTGILEDEIHPMNEVFNKYITQHMPFVVTKSAQTLDGKIATAKGESKWITSEDSRKTGHRLRNDFDAILVGINTVLNDNPFLNATRKINPIRKIIVDTYLKIPLNSNLFKNTDPSQIIIAASEKANPKKLKQLNKLGVCVLKAPLVKKKISLRWLFKELAKREISSVLIEGGSKIIGSALAEKLVDKCILFIAPKIMGDETALDSISGLKLNHVDQCIKLRDLTFDLSCEDLLVQGYVYGNH